MRVDKNGYRIDIEKRLGIPFGTLISLERMLLCDIRKLHFIISELPDTAYKTMNFNSSGFAVREGD